MARTNESVLAELKEAALADVKYLTCTRERALMVMTDEAVAGNAALFAAKPEIGLREFVGTQDSIGGRFAAFVATVQHPFLLTWVALSKLPKDDDALIRIATMSGLTSIVSGELDACTDVVADVCLRLGIVGIGRPREENQAAADAFMDGCINEAVELALSTKENPVIQGDLTPGVTH